MRKFGLERATWDRLGHHFDPRPLGERPWREVEEYLEIMSAVAQIEKADMAAAEARARARR